MDAFLCHFLTWFLETGSLTGFYEISLSLFTLLGESSHAQLLQGCWERTQNLGPHDY